MKQARMKLGVSPILLGGSASVPPHPAYWDVPQSEEAGVALLVKAGMVEYKPFQEGGGRFSKRR